MQLLFGGVDDGRGYTIAIQPIGVVSAAQVKTAKAIIEKTFRCSTVTLRAHKLPNDAFYAPRGRYRAEKLLGDLGSWTPNSFDKVIGLTAVDISTTKDKHKDWGIFGLGLLGKRPCVVSSYRLIRAKPKSAFGDRFRQTIVHELGHTFGLPHCPNSHCVMVDANGMASTFDKSTINFCATCSRKISTALR